MWFCCTERKKHTSLRQVMAEVGVASSPGCVCSVGQAVKDCDTARLCLFTLAVNAASLICRETQRCTGGFKQAHLCSFAAAQRCLQVRLLLKPLSIATAFVFPSYFACNPTGKSLVCVHASSALRHTQLCLSTFVRTLIDSSIPKTRNIILSFKIKTKMSSRC